MTADGSRADAAAWAAVAAGTLGAMMATLDISIVNSALPTIQGEIGATSTEGTWIATAYLVAEIIIIPWPDGWRNCSDCATCCWRPPGSSPGSRCCAA